MGQFNSRFKTIEAIRKPTLSSVQLDTYEGDTPSPLAYCVPLNFGIAYCVPPFFGLAYCVPFNNKNNHFGRFHLHKEVKITVCCMYMYCNS